LKPINTKTKPARYGLSILLLLSLLPCPALAFYQWEEGDYKLEATGLLRGFGMGLQNPDNAVFYDKHNLASAGAFARLMLASSWDNAVSLEIHAEQSFIPTILQTGGSRFPVNPGVERSDALAWSNLNQQALLQFDRFNLQYISKTLTFKFGRQPLNLASTFFFTPNDFFSPFAAQTFFRNYKSGVDAARLDVQLGEFSQLSLISVLGYSPKADTDNGWSQKPDLARTSYLARVSTVVDNFEWAILGGKVRKNEVIGLDFQGEAFEWLGIRGEGHLNFSQQPHTKNSLEFALSFEHRWENTFTLRLEQFYHGAGANSVDDYTNQLLARTDNTSPYLARLYTALGISYEITPLLTGNATFLYNGVDHSSLIALYANYSLTDESELAFSLNVPFGHKPDGYHLKNEFGLYPRMMSLEYRYYF
jgi:hypothetical protein